MTFDPDESLEKIGAIINTPAARGQYAALAEEIRALHEHISHGGALPWRWELARLAAIQELVT